MKMLKKAIAIILAVPLLIGVVFIIINSIPKNPKEQYIESQLKVANSYLAQSRLNPEETKPLEDAIKLYEKILKSDAKNKECLEMLAEAYTTKGEYDKARKLYDQLLKLDPKNMLYQVNMGFFYLAQDMKNEAFEKAGLAILHDPENSRAYFLRAIIYERDRNIPRAIADYKKAIETASGQTAVERNISIYLNLGYLLARSGLIYDAAQQYEKIIKLWPRVTEGYLALAQFYSDTGLIDKAIATLNSLVSMDKRSARGYNGLGIVYLKKGDAKSAYACFKKAESLGVKVDEKLLKKLEEKAKETK